MRTAAQILGELGIRRPDNETEFSSTCPKCSATRARRQKAKCLSVLLDDRGIRWNCHHCEWHGHEFYDELGAPNRVVVPNPRVPMPENGNGRRALELWAESGPLLGSAGETYLRSRKITKLPPEIGRALRFHPQCPFAGSFHPCVVALFRDVLTNKPKAIHRIRIDGGGKFSLGPKSGCAIKLSPDEDVEQGLAIGEGVETMLAAWQHGFRPAWACGDAANLRAFPVLAGVDGLHIIVDLDPPDEHGHRKGPEAATETSGRWTAAGRDVFRVVPTRIGADFNDVAKARR